MKITPLFSPVLVLNLLALAVSHSANAVVLLSQNFDNSESSARAASYVGWNSYMGATATDMTSTAPTNSSNNRIGLSNATGNPNTSTGYLLSVNQTTASLTFAAIDTFTALEPGEITWKMGNSSVDLTVRLLVQSGGNWYASAGTFSTAAFSTAASFASSGESKSLTYNSAAANWLNFTLTPNTAMTLGSAPALDLGSSITGIGFYTQHPTATAQTMRIDTLVINSVVPEPSAIGVILFAGLSVAVVRRRQR